MRRHGSGACPQEEARGLRGHDLDRQVGKKVMLRANHLLVSIDDNLFQTSSTVTCNMKALENLESHPLDMGPAKVRSTEAQHQAVLRWDDVFGIGIKLPATKRCVLRSPPTSRLLDHPILPLNLTSDGVAVDCPLQRGSQRRKHNCNVNQQGSNWHSGSHASM
ncbi:hypothetical protein SETIT_1G128300v2 [Setaria italica]|uniref:Uncharacterized protein n=2 Tax=Setaria italica TaxID=4555 RepID=A0A368PJM9_SETIT|nr:uncharacterized protein LOC101780194 [Setaria italica]RCV06001.1 hypothetical protein SETIT_1G128300v2 [Setaria italica]